MIKTIYSHLALLLILAASPLFAQDRLFYERPAVPGAQALENVFDEQFAVKGNPKGSAEQQYLLEALPLGNGRLGAMFSGGIDKEILVINDITLWANADYHHNINLAMNYWMVETANLPESFRPYLDYVKIIAESGAHTARETYGIANGWTAGMNGNIYGLTARLSKGHRIGQYGGWLTHNLFDHYAFNQDPDTLQEVYRRGPIYSTSAARASFRLARRFRQGTACPRRLRSGYGLGGGIAQAGNYSLKPRWYMPCFLRGCAESRHNSQKG